MEKKECYNQKGCRSNLLGCDCKVLKTNGKPSALKRMLIAASAVVLAISTLMIIIYIVSNLK